MIRLINTGTKKKITSKKCCHICDTINITATDADTFGTYSLTVCAIEFYEKPIFPYTKLYINL